MSTELIYPDNVVDRVLPPGELLLVYRLQRDFHCLVFDGQFALAAVDTVARRAE